MSAEHKELDDIEHSRLSAEQCHGWTKIPDEPKVEASPKKLVQDITAKVVVVGSPSGKTSLVSCFVHGKFDPDVKSTIGAAFLTKAVGVDGHSVQLQLWDTAGLEKYRGLVPMYCRNVVGALLVFDLTNRASFVEIEMWKELVLASAGRPVAIILIGNKSDVEERREVPEEEARAYANWKGMEYFETSAATGANVEAAFTACALEIARKKVNGKEMVAETARLKSEKKGSGCGK
jgi:small GTP-binding protein